MIILETSLLSLAFRRRWAGGRPPAVDHLDEMLESKTMLAIPGIVVQEILSGIRTESQFQETKAGLSAFPLLLAQPRDHFAAAKVFNVCAANGVALSTVDCLIAAQAMARGASLWTLDEDFTRIARHTGLKLYRPS